MIGISRPGGEKEEMMLLNICEIGIGDLPRLMGRGDTDLLKYFGLNLMVKDVLEHR